MNQNVDIEKAKIAFANFDKDGDGLISLDGKCLRKLNFF